MLVTCRRVWSLQESKARIPECRIKVRRRQEGLSEYKLPASCLGQLVKVVDDGISCCCALVCDGIGCCCALVCDGISCCCALVCVVEPVPRWMVAFSGLSKGVGQSLGSIWVCLEQGFFLAETFGSFVP